MNEERDFIKDSERFFGETPEMVTALALMVDTDNTGARGRAWFDDLELRELLDLPPPTNAASFGGMEHQRSPQGRSPVVALDAKNTISVVFLDHMLMAPAVQPVLTILGAARANSA